MSPNGRARGRKTLATRDGSCVDTSQDSLETQDTHTEGQQEVKVEQVESVQGQPEKQQPSQLPSTSSNPLTQTQSNKKRKLVSLSSDSSSPVTCKQRRGDDHISLSSSEEVEEEGGNSHSNLPKTQTQKKRKGPGLSDKQTCAVIEWVKSHGMLWDKCHEDYTKSKSDKHLVWTSGAKMLNFPNADALINEWKMIRDNFVKMHKDFVKSGPGFIPRGRRRKLVWEQANFLEGEGGLTHTRRTNLNLQNSASQTDSSVYLIQPLTTSQQVTKGALGQPDCEDISQPGLSLTTQSPTPPPPDVCEPGPLMRLQSHASFSPGSSRSSLAGHQFSRTSYSVEEYEAVLRDRDQQREAYNRILQSLPQPACSDPTINTFCNFLATALLNVPEQHRFKVQFDVLDYVRSYNPELSSSKSVDITEVKPQLL